MFKIQKSGFTIVEILIYMSIVMVLFIVVGSMMVSILQSQSESQRATAVESDGRFLLSRLGYDIRRANGLATPGLTGQTHSSLTLSVQGQPVAYYLEGENLYLESPSGTFRLNSFLTSVSDFSATRLENIDGLPSVQIRLSIRSLDEQRSYTSSFVLRNQL